MSPAGAMITESGRSISTTIGNAIALYPLKTIRQQTGSGSYDVGIDDVLYPNNWTVQGYGNGIMILHNRMSVSAAGTYRIRARYESLVSDWVKVIVIE